ncbi:predicted protein [Clavispora lusitaniae ATCC 42720]|uniref:Uncharacterized protein n=1 Tax=Clavispora lusitaniae (strain ATCC 42720) TaxID=306902 RepID=C4Y2Y4_CLAL4|nr:uncharacterized protein CLUG_02897 [Clavispora lusitaniae ATCC 42720]EEQ38771.1 predicted protein [Clavispora lusitaniae ATCC 42720]
MENQHASDAIGKTFQGRQIEEVHSVRRVFGSSHRNTRFGYIHSEKANSNLGKRGEERDNLRKVFFDGALDFFGRGARFFDRYKANLKMRFIVGKRAVFQVVENKIGLKQMIEDRSHQEKRQVVAMHGVHVVAQDDFWFQVVEKHGICVCENEANGVLGCCPVGKCVFGRWEIGQSRIGLGTFIVGGDHGPCFNCSRTVQPTDVLRKMVHQAVVKRHIFVAETVV